MWIITRTKCTRVETYYLNGFPCDYTYETEEIGTAKTAKAGWAKATEDLKQFDTSPIPWNPPVGHISYRYDVRKGK